MLYEDYGKINKKNFRKKNQYLFRISILIRDSLLIEKIGNFAVFVHRDENIASADELSLHINLWNRRPFAVNFDAFAELRVCQHVVVTEFHVVEVKHLEIRDFW